LPRGREEEGVPSGVKVDIEGLGGGVVKAAAEEDEDKALGVITEDEAAPAVCVVSKLDIVCARRTAVKIHATQKKN
jgi:hypothetical protein